MIGCVVCGYRLRECTKRRTPRSEKIRSTSPSRRRRCRPVRSRSDGPEADLRECNVKTVSSRRRSRSSRSCRPSPTMSRRDRAPLWKNKNNALEVFIVRLMISWFVLVSRQIKISKLKFDTFLVFYDAMLQFQDLGESKLKILFPEVIVFIFQSDCCFYIEHIIYSYSI